MADTGASTRHDGARHDVSKRPGHLTGMATAHHVSSTQARCRPAKPSAAGQRTAPPPHAPARRHATPRSSLFAAFPWAASASTSPPRLALGAKTRPRSLPRKGRENFPERRRRPSGNSSASAFRLCPLHARLPAGSIRPARRQGGRPRHEEASNHGKERRREAARGGTRVPEAQGHRGSWRRAGRTARTASTSPP